MEIGCRSIRYPLRPLLWRVKNSGDTKKGESKGDELVDLAISMAMTDDSKAMLSET